MLAFGEVQILSRPQTGRSTRSDMRRPTEAERDALGSGTSYDGGVISGPPPLRSRKFGSVTLVQYRYILRGRAHSNSLPRFLRVVPEIAGNEPCSCLIGQGKKAGIVRVG